MEHCTHRQVVPVGIWPEMPHQVPSAYSMAKLMLLGVTVWRHWPAHSNASCPRYPLAGFQCLHAGQDMERCAGIAEHHSACCCSWPPHVFKGDDAVLGWVQAYARANGASSRAVQALQGLTFGASGAGIGIGLGMLQQGVPTSGSHLVCLSVVSYTLRTSTKQHFLPSWGLFHRALLVSGASYIFRP